MTTDMEAAMVAGLIMDAATDAALTREWDETLPALPPELQGDGPCNDCGTLNNPVWFTDNVVWNRVTGEEVYAEDHRLAILCINCFIVRADARGLKPTGWRLLPEMAVARGLRVTPIEPKVARVSRRPICIRCAATRHLVFGDGPVVCRDCIRMAGRLAQVSRVASHDDDVREGWES